MGFLVCSHDARAGCMRAHEASAWPGSWPSVTSFCCIMLAKADHSSVQEGGETGHTLHREMGEAAQLLCKGVWMDAEPGDGLGQPL